DREAHRQVRGDAKRALDAQLPLRRSTGMFCEFEAPDVESVRDAYRNAGVEFVRAWGAELYKR
ncbi:MAG TPA: hypothetical protein VKQ32_30140, partial [Polyangia bacterium]|nr:hypothetical protein [Polyangia bacterium]